MKKILEKIKKFLRKLFGSSSSGGSSSGGSSSGGGGSTPAHNVIFAYGGFDFTKAKEDQNAVIKNLVVGGDSMKYSWKSGNLSGWGLSDTDANAIAVFAVLEKDGKWRGGKFEWISKSRTTRSFGNIRAGYNGWPKDSIEKAKAYGFCIVSKDGKKRTNWIFTDERHFAREFRASCTPIDLMD